MSDDNGIRGELYKASAGAIATGVIGYFTQEWWIPLWDKLKQTLSLALSWVMSEHPVHGWVLMLYWSAVVLCAIIIIEILREAVSKAPQNIQTSSPPGGEIFLGIRWRWQATNHGMIIKIAPFCRECDMQIQPEQEGGYYSVGTPQTAFRCDRCGVGSTLKGSYDSISDRVIREIQRNIRNNNQW